MVNSNLGCQFVPPYLLRKLVTKGASSDLIRCCEGTLSLDDRLRSRRTSPPQSLQPPRQAAISSDAVTGTRTIHTAKNTEDLPGEVVRGPGDPVSGDLSVDEAYDSSGQAWDLFAEVLGRMSVDGKGTPLSVTVHYGVNYDNAFWDGQQLVFGDGDQKVFDRFTKPMDVMAHEFTHGVTQFTAGLTYQGQPGALNESVSDAFAAMAKQRNLAQTSDQADWLIGEGLFMPGIKAKALRSMKEPGTAYDDPQLGKDPQVGSMQDYDNTSDDNDGVHINSGIPNRAFCLAAIGIGGNSWERPGHIWYDALSCGSVTANTDFAGFAAATVASAQKLFADDSTVADQVQAAWTTVGVLGADQPVPDPSTDSAPDKRVAVRRSGGFAGMARAAEMDLRTDPHGPHVQELLDRVDFDLFHDSAPMPDRFIYHVQYGPSAATVGEQDLTPALGQVVQIVLGDTA